MRARVFHAALVTGALFAAPGWALTTNVPGVAVTIDSINATTRFQYGSSDLRDEDPIDTSTGAIVEDEISTAGLTVGTNDYSGDFLGTTVFQSGLGFSGIQYQSILLDYVSPATSMNTTNISFSITNSGPTQFIGMNINIEDITWHIEGTPSEDSQNPFFAPAATASGNGVFYGYDIIDTTDAEPGVSAGTAIYRNSAYAWTYAENDTQQRGFDTEGDFLAGAMVPVFGYGDFIRGWRGEFLDVNKRVGLGLFEAGETRSFSVGMRLGVMSNSNEVDVTATIGDPFDFTGSGFNIADSIVSMSDTPAVPLPAGAWLMISGLGALGVARRARRARG